MPSVYVFREYLDSEWVSTEAFAATQAEFLRQKYSGRNVRVIVVEANPALRFVLKFRDRMFPGVPVVHVAIGTDQLEGVSLPADFVGKSIDLDPTETLRFALRLQPRAERIVIVTGAAPRDRVWDQRLSKAVAQLEGHPEVEYLAGLPTAAVLQRLRALSKDTIVFTPGYVLDGAGQVGTPAQSAKLIGSASAAPVYGPFDTFIGTGMVGGYMAPFDDQANPGRRPRGAPAERHGANGDRPVEVRQCTGGRLASTSPLATRRKTVARQGRGEISRTDGVGAIPGADCHRDRGPAHPGGPDCLTPRRAPNAAPHLDRAGGESTAHESRGAALRVSPCGSGTWRATDSGRPPIRSRGPTARMHGPLLSRTPWRSAHPADREQLDRAVRKALATGEELDVEYRITEPDGAVRWIAARGRAKKGNGAAAARRRASTSRSASWPSCAPWKTAPRCGT